MPSILVIGSINMDQHMVLPRFPVSGETVMGKALSYSPGGKGGNAAIAARRLGAQVRFAGCVGRDGFGDTLRRTLCDEDVDCSLLRTTDQAPTGLAPILVEDGGLNRIIVFPGANMCIRQEDVPAMFQEKVDAVMMQLEIPQEVILAAGREAKKRGIPVVLDAGPAQDFPVESLESLFILSPNETETTALTGLPVDTDQQVRAAAAALQARSGAPYIVLKLGARGAYVLGQGADAFVPAFPVQAVDPTAAGDTFTGAMTIEYLRSGNILQAVTTACAAGALCATRMGAQISLPTMEEVRAFLEERGAHRS